MNEMLSKKEQRKLIHEKIASLPDDYIVDSNALLFSMVTSLEEYRASQNIMLFYSVKREPDTVRIAEDALASGKTVAFPYCYRDGIMDARVVTSLDEMEEAMLGIPAPPDTAKVIAPEELDLILVPALAYDTEGYRIGYGGGYYDRFLPKTDAFTIGLAREQLLMKHAPREPHDIAVNCIITELNVYIITTPE